MIDLCVGFGGVQGWVRSFVASEAVDGEGVDQVVCLPGLGRAYLPPSRVVLLLLRGSPNYLSPTHPNGNHRNFFVRRGRVRFGVLVAFGALFHGLEIRPGGGDGLASGGVRELLLATARS